MKKSMTVFVVLLLRAMAFADFDSDAKGTTTANFLKLGVGARAVGMGEAYGAAADDATALYWNPAAMTRLENQSATFMHAPYLASTFYDYGAYARRVGRHAFGAGIQYFSAGSLDQTDENNTPLGHFNPYDLAASIGYAYQISNRGAAYGVTGKYIQSKILSSAQAFAVDFGALSSLIVQRFRLAFTAANIGTKMKFDQEAERLPLALRIGSSCQISGDWLGTLDLAFPIDNHPYVAIGTDYVLHPTSGMGLAGRLGYNSLTQGDISGVTGLSFGVGFLFEKLSLDYAFLPYGGVGLTHRISLNFKWGSSETPFQIMSDRGRHLD